MLGVVLASEEFSGSLSSKFSIMENRTICQCGSICVEVAVWCNASHDPKTGVLTIDAPNETPEVISIECSECGALYVTGDFSRIDQL